MAGQPRAPFYLAVFLVVAFLIGFAVYRSMGPAGGDQPGGGGGVAQQGGGESSGGEAEGETTPDSGSTEGAEAPDTASITTVKEYTFKSSERLPPVKGTAGYQPMRENTVRFALNVWAGWAPIIFANEGFKPGKIWKAADGKDFKVELVLIDNPIEMRDAFAAGEVHIGWATVDMLPLIVDGFVDSSGNPRDSRVMPRVYQQVDWSNGGDGIVARESIKTVGDLRGKRVALAENSPSHYFLLSMLVAAGVQPAEVKMDFTGTAFEAAAAFNSDKGIAAAVSWAPDIYNLSEVRGNRMLVSTETANKLIADVWFARADFAKDHPGVIAGLVRGIFDGMEALKTDANREKCAELMASGYGLSPGDALGMMKDAHSTNWAENYQFLLNANNPTNFARVWGEAYRLYRKVRAISNTPVPFDQVIDFSVIQKLGEEEKYRSQRDEYTVRFVPKSTKEVKGAEEILTNTVVIHFAPNSWEIYKKVVREEEGKTIESDYDPRAKYVIEEIAKMAGQFGNARIIIEGHTDSSMKGKGQGIEDLVRELSLNRANAVKEAVVNEYGLDPNKFNVEGYGWDVPADPSDPLNHAKNRRVEVKVFTAEQQ